MQIHNGRPTTELEKFETGRTFNNTAFGIQYISIRRGENYPILHSHTLHSSWINQRCLLDSHTTFLIQLFGRAPISDSSKLHETPFSILVLLGRFPGFLQLWDEPYKCSCSITSYLEFLPALKPKSSIWVFSSEVFSTGKSWLFGRIRDRDRVRMRASSSRIPPSGTRPTPRYLSGAWLGKRKTRRFFSTSSSSARSWKLSLSLIRTPADRRAMVLWVFLVCAVRSFTHVWFMLKDWFFFSSSSFHRLISITEEQIKIKEKINGFLRLWRWLGFVGLDCFAWRVLGDFPRSRIGEEGLRRTESCDWW